MTCGNVRLESIVLIWRHILSTDSWWAYGEIYITNLGLFTINSYVCFLAFILIFGRDKYMYISSDIVQTLKIAAIAVGVLRERRRHRIVMLLWEMVQYITRYEALSLLLCDQMLNLALYFLKFLARYDRWL
jgi:hypothetical protein